MKARDAALSVLADGRAGRLAARRSLDDLLSRYRIEPLDVALANELVWGVTRHRLTIEAVLRIAVGAKWRRLGHALRHILLVGAYQLVWLDAVPAFAAVNEAVEQAKREGGRNAGAFVNGVLRNVQRHVVDRAHAEPPADARSCVPTGQNRFCRFDVPVLPDPADDWAAHLSAAASHPEVLVRRWIEAYGRERAAAICTAGTRQPPTFLRPNTMRNTAQQLARRLEAEGCRVQLVREDFGATETTGASGLSDVLVLVDPPTIGPLLKLAAFREGLFQPQDITAMQPICTASPEPGWVMLDLCAGYGTKATQAAELMRDRGAVLATDTDAEKLERLDENCRRLGLTCVRATPMGDLDAAAAAQPRIDLILVDVPCSNTGVLARRPEARYRFHERTLQSLTAAQTGLLRRAAALARAHTRICYSTCSIEREENEAIAFAFCRAGYGWRIARSHLTLPQCGDEPADWRDGGFAAILVRE